MLTASRQQRCLIWAAKKFYVVFAANMSIQDLLLSALDLLSERVPPV